MAASSPTRVVALASPVVAAALTTGALVLGGSWPAVAAVAGAALCALLGRVAWAADRRRRIEVARTRAEQARAYDALHEQHAAEQLEVTGHLVAVLDEVASSRDCLRARLSEVQADLGTAQRDVVRAELAAASAAELRSRAEQRASAALAAAAEVEALLAEALAQADGALDAHAGSPLGSGLEDHADLDACETVPPPRSIEPPLVEPLVERAPAPVEELAATA